MSASTEILSYGQMPSIQTHKMINRDFTIKDRCRINDGVFKVPFPRRPQNQFRYQISSQQQRPSFFNNTLSIYQKQKQLSQMKIIERYNEMKQKLQNKKINDGNFLARMKYLASLSENQNARFLIPQNFINTTNKILTQSEIDQFIINNKLIIQQPVVQLNSNFEKETDNQSLNYEISTDKKEKVIVFNAAIDYYQNQNEDASTTDGSYESNNENCYQDEEKIGQYTFNERSKKIMKYKSKIQKRRQQIPISKKFNGRSQIAFQKVRINGKFAKKL